MRVTSCVLALFALTAASTTFAQGPNPTNIWSASLRWKAGSLVVGKPVKLTHDEGSNSQPSFAPNGKFIVFSAVRDTGPDARSDIYAIDLASGKERRVTFTPENENSPTVNAKGEYAAVRWVPATLFLEPPLWTYKADGTPLAKILPNADSTGYYTLLSNGNVALTRPKSKSFTIALFDAKTGAIVEVDSGVPALPAQRIPGENALSYVRIDSANARHELHRVDLRTHTVSSLGSTLVGRTSHAWLPQHRTIVMAKGHTLYARRVGARDSTWHAVATFDDPQLRNANAYAVSPSGDRLIMTSPVRAPLATLIRDSIESGVSARDVAAQVRQMKDAGRLAEYDVAEGGVLGLVIDRIHKKLPGDALSLAGLATAMWPDSYRSYTQLGDAYRAMSDTVSAMAAYRKAIELNPRATDAQKTAASSVTARIMSLGGTP